ncbi:MAG: transposase [Erysipelotrichia bacterium]|nr:transposase [Erysipelotrichia bacterium]NCC55118.1 transposase [Erysipelotrichia bacterium]
MYIVIKLLVDNDSVKEDVFNHYQKVFTDETKRCAEYMQKKNKELELWKVSSYIHYSSRYALLREAKKLTQLKKFNEHSIVIPVWSNKSYVLSNDRIRLLYGESYQLPYVDLRLRIRDYQLEQLKTCKLYSAKLKKSNQYWYVYITANKQEKPKTKSNISMGVDLGIRVPAVCVTSNNHVKFVGNGRYIRFIERNLKAKYRKLDKAKNKKAIKKMNHKLANIKFHLDHEYSKTIINFAIEHNVSLIKLEKLTGIQTKMVKKRMKKEFLWSYYRMQTYLEQKAHMNGIQVSYVPAGYTSKRCPNCKRLNNPKGRNYKCRCGYQRHRDLVGAINILNSTTI